MDRRYRLFTRYCDQNFSPMRGATMFKEEKTLPGPELHSSVDNRHCLARSCQDHANMRRHVIAAFRAVRDVISIFWHKAIEEFLHVMSRGWIGILHDDDAATGVLNKDRHCPGANAALVYLCLDVIGDFIHSLAVGTNLESIVMHVHWSARYSTWL